MREQVKFCAVNNVHLCGTRNPEISVNIFTLLAVTQSVDNLFHSFIVLCENEACPLVLLSFLSEKKHTCINIFISIQYLNNFNQICPVCRHLHFPKLNNICRFSDHLTNLSRPFCKCCLLPKTDFQFETSPSTKHLLSVSHCSIQLIMLLI